MNEIIYTWSDFSQDTQQIVASIRSSFHHGPGGRQFTGIYAIPRGGLVLGVALSHALELPMIMGGVDKHVLVVDDIADKGHTLEPYRKRGCAIATLFRHVACPFSPMWFARENDRWVKFPWETF